MTTQDVCRFLECTERHVFDLRTRTYPKGHSKAGEPLLGDAWRVGRGWRYSDEAVHAYKRWVILGEPLDGPQELLNEQRSRGLGRALERAASA